MTALVEPPIAAFARIAFSNASRVRIVARPQVLLDHLHDPLTGRWAIAYRRESTAGQVADPGSCIPSASAMQAIVDAVPMVMQWPLLRDMQPSATPQSSCGHPPGVEVSASNLQTCGAGADVAGRGTCRSASARR